MKIIANTNVLLRAVLPDDGQRGTALEALRSAEAVAVSIHSLCEFSWVLERRYGAGKVDIAAAIRKLIDTSNVVVDRAAVDAGLSMLDRGGDFADGTIDFDGRWLGGETLVTFDKKPAKLLAAQGRAANVLA